MERTLTIVIPTYNMEGLLEKNLQTLVVKKGLKDYLEVLVVNDGSKDRSSEIARQFQDKYPQIFRVIDKLNGNYGSCINRGLKEANGKYIRIMDADDYYDTEGLEKQIEKLQHIDVDVMLTDYLEVNMLRGRNRIKSMTLSPNKVLTLKEVIDDRSFLDVEMHKITYRTENLRSINYLQTEGISYTDQEWDFLPMATVNKLYYFNTVVYKYLIGRVGQTIEINTYIKNLEQVEQILYRMIDQYHKQGKNFSTDCQKYLYHRIELLVDRIYTTCIIMTDNMGSQKLKNFEFELPKRDMFLFKKTDNYLTFKLNHYRYIKAWRRNKFYDRIILQILHRGFVFLLKRMEKNTR